MKRITAQEKKARQKVLDQHQSKIEKIFGEISDYSEHEDSVRFHVSGTSVSFELFLQLSEILKTTEIRFNRGFEGCDTCGYGRSVEIRAKGVLW